jgi:23S rRNA pseudouridine1911/1915/1917 synthase
MASQKLMIHIPAEYAGKRLDRALAELCPQYSRSRLQQWLRQGHVRRGSTQPKGADKVSGGETIELQVPQEPQLPWQAQAIPLDVVHEDDELLVINKPAGLVVHPGPGNREGTLLNALLHHVPALREIARAGIVHRLDKDTSGLLVVAKSEAARMQLIEQLRTRSLRREYLAIVNGVMIAGGDIDAPIGRHPQQRTRMAVNVRGKSAVSRYRVKARYRAHTLVDVRLQSGRTHQIRVHMAHIGFPIVGDPLYGGRLRVPPDCSEDLPQVLRAFRRQALHAVGLGLIHPLHRKSMSWTAPLPDDMRQLVDALEQDALAPTPTHKGRG